jgi:hypothetical protein
MPTVETPTTVRDLPEAEWPRLRAFEPFASSGIPEGAHWRILVAEQGPEIVGFCCLFDAVHFEPWFIAPEHRGNPAIVRGLLRQAKQVLVDNQIPYVFACVQRVQALPGVTSYEQMLGRLGFEPAPGVLYLLQTDDLPEG